MSLLLVVVLLFFSSSCSVSSGQYYVSDDCSSVTQSPCNPLSVYAGNMSQYSKTTFYFIGTSVINFTVTVDSVQNITLHGLDQSSTIHCSSGSIAINTSNHVSFSNMLFQQCNIQFIYSSNITITGSIFKSQRQSLGFMNVFDSKITSSVFDSVNLLIRYYPPPVCYNELHHYSLTLTNVIMAQDYFWGSNHRIDITVKSCSIRDNDEYGLAIDGRLSASAHISVIDTELVGSKENVIIRCNSVLLNNVTVANSLSTGLFIASSVVTVENRLVFKNNTGVVGGGMAINSSSIVALSPSANLEFIDNHATYKGGGIYIDESAGCGFIQVSRVPLTLKDNTAGVAGNDIYGRIYPDFDELFNSKNPSTSSDPREYAPCDPDSNETTPIWYDDEQQSVFPGQPLKYNFALFGRSSDSNSYSLTDGRITIEINGTICPIGFSVNSSGLCDCSVSRENVTCDINTLDITHNGLLWIGTYHTSTPFNANETNPNACIINEDCLLYCSPNPVTFQFNHTHTQCVDNRGHRMCGSCTEGRSLLMGSNKCGQCHNNYMMIGWIALFAVMGVLLVVLLIALNLTVSVGTLNGLLFYANIVKLYEPVFSRKGPLPVLNQVISWINLDFGFEICFYNGMDSYAKQWLQFAFPLYLWIIIIIIIQLCRRYGKISRLMGSHAVPVLSTLFLLSYTKLVRTLVIVLHKREVTLHCTNESVRSVSLWYKDPNVEYAKGKHAGLFGFALLNVQFTDSYSACVDTIDQGIKEFLDFIYINLDIH
uniref:Right handed beta helix domain-containing protein n=1 Tax=Amphimedon queenslandica TaxID=400682 RepID=A0A1X7U2Y0_AMPQE